MIKKTCSTSEKLKQALNHGLKREKLQSVIKVNQKDCLKSYINLQIKL